MDIREAIANDTFDNFDVIVDNNDLLQVKCDEGRFVAEAHLGSSLVSLIQGNEIFIWHKQNYVSCGNDLIATNNKDITVKIYFEDLSNLYD